MTAAILSILPKPKGRKAVDGREILRLYPSGRRDKWGSRVFIYAIAFEGDVVKVGQTTGPRARLTTHWRSANGEVKWVHLFESMHKQTARLVEVRAPSALSGLVKQINKSEWFFASATRSEVIAAIRPLIAACKLEVNGRFERSHEEALRRQAMTQLLIDNGFLPTGNNRA